MNGFDGSTPEQMSPGSQEGRIYLYCVRSSVRVAAVLESPELMAAVVDDACLRFAMQDWFGRIPPRRHHRDRVRWDAEGAFLRRQKQRLAPVMEQALAQAPAAQPEDC